MRGCARHKFTSFRIMGLHSLFYQDKKGKKDKTTLSRLKRTFSNRGQKLMEKLGGGRLQRSTSRENLIAHSKLEQSERISRSTPMLAQFVPPDKVLICTQLYTFKFKILNII